MRALQGLEREPLMRELQKRRALERDDRFRFYEPYHGAHFLFYFVARTDCSFVVKNEFESMNSNFRRCCVYISRYMRFERSISCLVSKAIVVIIIVSSRDGVILSVVTIFLELNRAGRFNAQRVVLIHQGARTANEHDRER